MKVFNIIFVRLILNISTLNNKINLLNNKIQNIYEIHYYNLFNKINFNKTYTDIELRETDFYKHWIKIKNDYYDRLLNNRIGYKYSYEDKVLLYIKTYFNIYNKILNNKKINPIDVVIDSKNNMYIYDGIHRSILYNKIGISKIQVKIFKCDDLENDLHEEYIIKCNNIIKNKLITKHEDIGQVYIDIYGCIHPIIYSKTDIYRIVYRDPEWIKFRKLINKPYQVIDHPDLIKKGGYRGDLRLKLLEPHIKNIVSSINGILTGLDVGSSFGNVTRYLSKLNFNMSGIEHHSQTNYIASYLNKYYNTNITYYEDDIIRWINKNKTKKYDLIVCLSIIHNIMWTDPQLGINILYQFSKMGKYMIFDIGQNNEGSKVQSIGLELTVNNLENFIKTNTVYKNVKFIGKDTEYCNRNLYILY